MTLAYQDHTDGASTRFVSRRSLRRFMRWEEGLPAETVAQIWKDPSTLLARGKRLHQKLMCTVAKIDSPTGPLILKRQNAGPAIRRMKKSFSRSPSSRSWELTQRLRHAGVTTPRSRAIAEELMGPFRSSCSLLTDYVPGDTLYRLIRSGRANKEMMADIADQIARMWTALTELKVCHNDFKPENILVDHENRVWLIDLDRMKQERSPSRLRRRQAQDLRDLLHLRSWRTAPAMYDAFRGALLRTPAFSMLAKNSADASSTLTKELSASSLNSQSVTVLIPCQRWSRELEACIQSARDLANETIVASAGSADIKPAGLQGLNECRFIHRAHQDEAEFEAWAHQHSTSHWTVRLLPHERLTPELCRQIQDKIAEEPKESAFLAAHAVVQDGRCVRSGKRVPPPSVRLYRTELAHFELVEGRVVVSTPTASYGHLKSRLINKIDGPGQQSSRGRVAA